MTEPRLHVSFVCSGNICRSPMAALVFRTLVEREGLADVVKVSSAGIGGWHAGEAADKRAQAILRTHGYQTEHIAAEVDAGHLGADLLLAADNTHVLFLREKVSDPDRVHLLRAFDPSAARDAEVFDPYYGADDGFEEVLGMIERAMPGLLLWVRENR